jgi:hypothetical protein
LLQGEPITAISLNITPEFRPQTTAAPEVYRTKDEQLAKAPAREFRNRQGEVIAEGRFIDYINGRVIVQQADGQVLRIPDYHLSERTICALSPPGGSCPASAGWAISLTRFAVGFAARSPGRPRRCATSRSTSRKRPWSATATRPARFRSRSSPARISS